MENTLTRLGEPEEPNTPDRPRGHAIMRIVTTAFTELLTGGVELENVPLDLRVERVTYDIAYDALLFRVSSASYPVVADGAVAPLIELRGHRKDDA